MPLLGELNKNYKTVNRSVPRIDGVDKVTGRAHYAADLKFVDMVYGGCLRSGRSHAKVTRIDTSKANVIPGVLAVVTADDMPKPKNCAGQRPLYDPDRKRSSTPATWSPSCVPRPRPW